MRIVVLLLGGTLLASTAPAMAQEVCARPAPPAAIDGSTVTMEQLKAAKAEVAAFLTASDAYQTCVFNDLAAQRDAAKARKSKLDGGVEKAAEAKVAANQAEKERVGAEFNKAARAFRAAHPS